MFIRKKTPLNTCHLRYPFPNTTIPLQLTGNKVMISVRTPHSSLPIPAWLSTWRMFAETSDCQMWLITQSFLQVSHFKKLQRFVQKLNIEFLYDPAIPLLGIYPKEQELRYLYIMFTAVLLTIPQGRNNPSIHGQVYNQTVAYIYIYIYIYIL